MAENVIKSLSEDFLHCAICTEPYNEPKMLPCLHTFCLQCLERWASNRHDKPLSCPTCRCAVDMPCAGINGLPSNFFLVSLKERLEEVSRISGKNTDYNCNICKSKVDILFCLDCMMHICNGCKEIHDGFTRSNDHPLIPSDKMSDESYLKRVMSAQAPYCNTHKQEKVRYYCTQCTQLACQVCATISHQGHQSLHEVMSRVTSIKADLETILKNSNTDLNTVLNKSKEMVKATENIKNEVAELRCKIDARYEEVLTKLQSDKQELQEQLNSIENSLSAELDDIDEKISQWLSKMKTSQQMTRTILEQENPWEILEMEKSIVESFKRLRLDKVQMKKLSTPAKVYCDFLPAKLRVLDKNLQEDKWNDNLPFECRGIIRLQSFQSLEEKLRDQVENLNEEIRGLKFREGLLKQINEVNILGTFKFHRR